jgi:FAD/FMN-containing dehydrogenase
LALPSGYVIENPVAFLSKCHACGNTLQDISLRRKWTLSISSSAAKGTLGVIVEAELKLLPKPEGLLSGVVFFDSEDGLINFVREARERSLGARGGKSNVRDVQVWMRARSNISTSNRSTSFARNISRFLTKPVGSPSSFEQETAPTTEEIADE